MKNLTIFLIALSVISCKARKVSLSKVDSNTTTNKEQQVSVISSTTDTGKVITNTTTVQKDSGSYQVEIETGGKTVNITNGNYSGPADKVTIKGKRQTATNQTQQIQETKGISTQVKTDSSSKEQSKTEFSKKVKDVATKPDYSWFLYFAIGIVIILLFIFIYFKVKK